MQAEVAQLQEQVALKDAEIERLHSQLSRAAALHGEHAERGEWFDSNQIQLSWVPFFISEHVCLLMSVCMLEWVDMLLHISMYGHVQV